VLGSETPLVSIVSEVGIRINPSMKLKLSGEIISKSSSLISSSSSSSLSIVGRAEWSVDDDSISLIDKSLSPINQNLSLSSLSLSSSQSNSNTKSWMMNLVLPSNTLPPQSTFRFTLKCSFILSSGTGSLISSFSSIVITTNSPPLPGVFEVSPLRGGRMMNTSFEFVSFGWEDVDLPLSYAFSYQSQSSSSSLSSSYLLIRSRQEISHCSSQLPKGNGNQFQLQTRLEVFDNLDGSSMRYVSEV